MYALLSLSLLLSLTVLRYAHGVESFPDSEYQALYDLYNATDGANWVCMPVSTRPEGLPWQFETKVNPCDPLWQGLTCATINETNHVNQLNVAQCSLQGTLPASISALTQLEVLDLSDNFLNGTLPPTITQLTHLVELFLEVNLFTGFVPDSWHNCTSLVNLDLSDNQFSGPIPPSMGTLTNLIRFLPCPNAFTGTIPAVLGNLSHLLELYLGWCPLSGTIPPEIFMPQLVLLGLDNTSITGQIPDFPPHSAVRDITMYGNRLSGTIPDSIANLSKLIYLDLSDNELTGIIPALLGSANTLQTVFLEGNSLRGSIPQSLFATNISTLSLASNVLSGTLPRAMQNNRVLLNLSYNALHGTLAEIAKSPLLYTLSLQGNRFSGSLDGVFSASQQFLRTVQLDDNQFTGTLPEAMFSPPLLMTLSIVGSCLHGTLPSNICNATQLEALVLYGLTTGASCRATGVHALSVNRRAFGGSLPSCLLRLPRLQTLLLSSNGLTGSLNNNWTVHDRLIELDLSHNRLSGTIPDAVMNHSWLQLDLSHNKLAGELNTPQYKNWTDIREELSDYGITVFPKPIYKLSGNRLSGNLPSSGLKEFVLSVLAGNLFACNYARTNLPQNDQNVNTYECASNSFDISVYVWIAALGVLGVCFVYLWRYLREASSTAFPMTVQSLLHCYYDVMRLGWACALVALVVLMPYYAIISQYEGTHTHQYAYVLSAIYTSGAVAFALDFVFWTLLLASVVWMTSRMQEMNSVAGTTNASRTKSTSNAHSLVYVHALYVLVNVVAVLGVNIAFVYIVLCGDSNAQSAAQLALSIFKTAWNTAVSPFLLRRLSLYYLSEDARQEESFFSLQLLVALFNNIAIPCLVVMAIDSNCFSEILLPPQTSSVRYLLPYCDESRLYNNGLCEYVLYSLPTLSFTPPFTYSYQCSASFVTAYAPAFVYMSLSTVLLVPLLEYALVRVHARLIPDSPGHCAVTRLLPGLLKLPNSAVVAASVPQGRNVVGATSILVTLFTHLSILLTFGVVFPPVALAMAVSMTAVVVVTRYKLQRFLLNLRDGDAQVQTQYLAAIDMECARVGSSSDMRRAVHSIICYCCIFYTLFLFDTLGDAQGFNAAVWVLVVVPLAPFVTLGINYAYLLNVRGGATTSGETKDAAAATVDVEMKTMIVNPLQIQA